MSLAQAASVLAAVLIAGVAVFQLALAAGVPFGEAVLGGKAPTNDGVLTPPFRILAVVQALVLVALGWVLLARTEVAGITLPAGGTPSWLIWTILVLLVLNTLGNFTAPHPIERWVMGSITLVLSGLTLVIALSAE